MTTADATVETQDIVVDELFPHSAETLWQTLTTAELMGRWLMPPDGFAPVVGTAFTFRTTAAGAWDGTIRCTVLDVVPNRRLSFSWQGGDEANEGYGSKLDTVVTLSLTPASGGTRLRLIHSGFVRPRNDTAYRNMSQGWVTVVRRLDTLAAEAGSGEGAE